jgi:hypothetical protein
VYDATRDRFYPYDHFYEKRIFLSFIIVLFIPFALNNYFKGKIVSFLRTYVMIDKNEIPSYLNMKIINNDILINLHKNYITDHHWLLIIWCFHNILQVSIYILDDQEKIIRSFIAKNTKQIIYLRITFNSYNNLPADVEVIYKKEKEEGKK